MVASRTIGSMSASFSLPRCFSDCFSIKQINLGKDANAQKFLVARLFDLKFVKVSVYVQYIYIDQMATATEFLAVTGLALYAAVLILAYFYPISRGKQGLIGWLYVVLVCFERVGGNTVWMISLATSLHSHLKLQQDMTGCHGLLSVGHAMPITGCLPDS